jgi:hypothetical protein
MWSAVVALAVILLAAVPPVILRAADTYGSRVKTHLVPIVHHSHVDPELPWTVIIPKVIGFGLITQDFILVGVVISKSAKGSGLRPLNLSQPIHPLPHFFSGLSFPLDPRTLVPFLVASPWLNIYSV